jgi:hypothetical protein
MKTSNQRREEAGEEEMRTNGRKLAVELFREDPNERLDGVGVLKDFECRGKHCEVLDCLEERREEVGLEHAERFDETCEEQHVRAVIGKEKTANNVRRTIARVEIASLTLRSD